MNKYFNPSNEEYKALCDKPYYVDKTALLAEFNNVKYPKDNRVSAYMPIGFGKTSILDMVTAFYSKGCDSRALFENKKIAETPNWDEHLNKYDVFRINMSEVINSLGKEDLIHKLNNIFESALKNKYPEIENSRYFFDGITLREIYNKTGDKFIIIIDDYDMVYLKEECREYIDYYDNFIEYLVGENSLFVEKCFVFGKIYRVFYRLVLRFDMRNANLYDGDCFNGMIGFKESEVKELCKKFNMDFNDIEEFFGSYNNGSFEDNVYNANSIITLIRDFNCDLDLYKNKNFLDLRLKNILSVKNNNELRDPSSIEILTEEDFQKIKERGLFEILLLFINSGCIAYDARSSFYNGSEYFHVHEFFVFLSTLGYIQVLGNYYSCEKNPDYYALHRCNCDYLIPNVEMKKTLNISLNNIPEFIKIKKLYDSSRILFHKIINFDSEYINDFFKTLEYRFNYIAKNNDAFKAFVRIMFNYCLSEYKLSWHISYCEKNKGVFFSDDISSFSRLIRPPMIFYVESSGLEIDDEELFKKSFRGYGSEVRYKSDKCIIIAINFFGNVNDDNDDDCNDSDDNDNYDHDNYDIKVSIGRVSDYID